MATKHIAKLTRQGAIIKLSQDNAAGATMDIDLATDLKLASETFTLANAEVAITQIIWSSKTAKDVRLSRLSPGLTLHGDYYLSGNGIFKFDGFKDSEFGDYDLRATFSGEGTLIVYLSKVSGYTV